MTVAHSKELNQIADTDKKTDRVDAKELARMVRLNSVPESYVPTDGIREACERVRGRQTLVENRTEYANKIHGVLSVHSITEDVKSLNVKGRSSRRNSRSRHYGTRCWSRISTCSRCSPNRYRTLKKRSKSELGL